MAPFLVLLLLGFVFGFEFEAPNFGKKCFFYHFNKDDVAHGTFSITNRPSWTQINLVVNELSAQTGPGEQADHVKEVSRKNDVSDKGTFAFTAKEGEQEICFEMNSRPGHPIGYSAPLRVAVTVTVKQIPKKGDLTKAELDKLTLVDKLLSKIRDSSEQMRTLVDHLHTGLEKRKETHDQADNGLGKLSFLFFFILILFGGGQLWYLTHFLKKKKLV